jgi:hypothetical protein
MGVWKTKTGTSGLTTAQTITVTSPNTKHIFLKQYVVATVGEPTPDGITIQITDEDSNVLWEDAIPKRVATFSTHTRVSHTFPGKGLMIPKGKNLLMVIGDPGAASGTEANILYTI